MSNQKGEMLNNSRTLQSAPLLMPAVALMAGIVAGEHADSADCRLVCVVCVTVAFCCYRWALLQSVAILASVAALGAVRSSSVQQSHESVAWPEGYVRYEAVVASEPAEKPKTTAIDVILCDDGRRVKCYVERVQARGNGGTGMSGFVIGDRLQLCSRIERNREWHKGTYDHRRYMEIHGFSGQTYVRNGDWQLLPRSWNGLSAVERLKLRFLCYRHTLLQRYRAAGAGDEQYAVLAAMTLGDKSAMTSELKDVYAVSGASHVLALSGLHLGIVYGLLTLLVVGRRWRFVMQWVMVAAIWAFVLLVGMPVSVVRAAVMISVFALVSLTGRGRMSLNVLSLSALIILIVSPDSLYDVGFQLSFAAMFAIVLLQPMFEGLVSRQYLFDRPLLRWLWGVTTVSVAAQVGTAPLLAYYFGRLSVYFLLTNLLVLPAATLILWMACPLCCGIAVAAIPLITIVRWLNGALSLIARLPCASIGGLHPSALQTAMVYVILFSLFLIVKRYDKHF